MTEPLLVVDSLTVDYGRRRSRFRAVDDVSFDISRNEVLALVGESGSGKTTIARVIQGVIEATSGSVRVNGQEVVARRLRDRRRLANAVQTVFQDPYGSMNPARTIGSIVAEPLHVQDRSLSRGAVRDRVATEIERVGLPARVLQSLPSALSGGQRQRVAIARALITRPSLVICDEAVSALDLSVQAQILNLLADLRQDLGIAYLFITHDLGVVNHMADRIAVLQRGRMVDVLTPDELEAGAGAEYTRRLFEAAPVPDPVAQREKRARFEELAAGRGTTEVIRL